MSIESFLLILVGMTSYSLGMTSDSKYKRTNRILFAGLMIAIVIRGFIV